jgi:hypothetical protein
VPSYKLVLITAGVSPRGRARYVLSLAPGWHITVVSGATAPSDADLQEIINECLPRWRIRYPGQSRL